LTPTAESSPKLLKKLLHSTQ